MGTQPDPIRKMYGPLKDKNVRNALAHRIGQEFPRVGGPRIRNLCAEMILEVLDEHGTHGMEAGVAAHTEEPGDVVAEPLVQRGLHGGAVDLLQDEPEHRLSHIISCCRVK